MGTTTSVIWLSTRSTSEKRVKQSTGASVLSLAAACVEGQLGIFLWYRPGLCQCRFRVAVKVCIGPESHNFLRRKPDLLPSKAEIAVPGRQHNCLLFALLSTADGVPKHGRAGPQGTQLAVLAIPLTRASPGREVEFGVLRPACP